MPKTARNPEDIEAAKERILDTALDIMCEDGFQYLSMRNLAARLGMTAANIYNYYSNKDELYLAIQTRGFELLYDQFSDICNSFNNPLDRLREMIKAYLEFGISNADYYDIMFTRNTPKYTDYVGTKMEPVALFEKQTALKVADITTKVIAQIVEVNHCIPLDDARYRTIQLWTALHGIVSLYNSRVLQEVDEYTDEVIERIVEDLMLHFAQ
jgi:AcrR family transcriptional regulator